MNYLAHLFLSCHDEQLLVGNFLADFIKKKEAEQLPASYYQGILFHRQIDQYTDQHDLVLKGVRRLYPRHSKYASVVIDIFYDYFLYQNWEKYTHESFSSFQQRIYAVLLNHLETAPSRIQYQISNMVRSSWLEVYGHKQGIENTFRRMQHRVSRPELLEDILISLEKDHDLLNEEFNAFFPDLISELDCFC